MDYIAWAEKTMERILEKLEDTAEKIGPRFPHVTKGREFDEKIPSWWTNGFWPGILWIAYKYTKNEKYASIAREIEEKLDIVLDEFDLIDHDAGFIWLLSAGASYRKDKNDKSRRRVLKAASFLASRFNTKGNFIRAWNSDPCVVIIDCMMNLPLLYWASNVVGDPRFRHVAEAHAKTVLKYFIRPDGSVNHIVGFDTETGEYEKVYDGQGASPDSAWSRGTAWALYGLALSYRHLKDEAFLNASKRVANFFLANLPEDMVCHWDFRVEKNADTPKDTSAAACAACGLLELSEFVSGAEGENYKEKAYQILRSLCDNYSNLDNEDDHAILFGGTGNAPKNIDINVGLIYGDYFFTEGVSRLAGNREIHWYSDMI